MSRPLKVAAALVIIYAAYHFWTTHQTAIPPSEPPSAPVSAPVVPPQAASAIVLTSSPAPNAPPHPSVSLEGGGPAPAPRAAPMPASPVKPAEPTLADQMAMLAKYWQAKDPALTPEYLDRMLALAPQEPLPHLIIADQLYDRDELAQAREHFDHARRAAAKADPGTKAVLDLLSAKLARLERAERGFLARTSSHFKVKFNGEENYDIWNRVLEILEDAYRDVGQRLGHFPAKPITVVLHTRETFQSATGGPAWADGLFDRLEGRIKVPTQNALTDINWLTQVLRHEYVHAVIHDRLSGRMNAIPQWLNEGLAMQLSGQKMPEVWQVLRGPVINLTYLEGTWGGLPSEAAWLAYVEANSATRYMIDRYGMERVHGIIGSLAGGQPFPNAFENGMLISYAEFQRRWVESLNDRT